jgi:hypothetical protein
LDALRIQEVEIGFDRFVFLTLQKPTAGVEDVNTTLQAFFFGRHGENKLQ